MYGLAFLPILLLWIKPTHHCESSFLAFRFYPHNFKGGCGGGGFCFLGFRVCSYRQIIVCEKLLHLVQMRIHEKQSAQVMC
jgi:hypothetical protein